MNTLMFEGVSPLLEWLPNETLFSQCSRQHRFWGYSKSSTTAKILFGSDRAGTQHDFPSHLAEFSRRTGSVLGPAKKLAGEHTLLRFYRPFLRDVEFDNAVATIGSTSVAHLKYKLGLLTSRFRANHPLKSCSQCIAADSQIYGWSYWHLDHQYPGVWTCTKHDIDLQECMVKSNGVQRFEWLLPSIQFISQPDKPVVDQLLDRRRSLSRMIVDLVEADSIPGYLAEERIRSVIFKSLETKGWITEAGHLRLKQIVDAFTAYSLDYSTIPELRGLVASEAQVTIQLGRLLRPIQTRTHPLRRLALLHWLFGSSGAFHQALSFVPNRSEEFIEQKNATENPKRHPYGKQAYVVQKIAAGKLVSSVAKEFGMDIATVKAWAAQSGLSTPRRASLLKPAVLQPLIQDLKNGDAKQVVATKYGVSISTINRVLRTEVGLHIGWCDAREKSARENARATWSSLLRESGHLGLKLMRAAEPATYAWLYRNDLVWLTERKPTGRSLHAHQRSTVRWDERDRVMKRTVQDAILKISLKQPEKKLKLWQIYQLVPELRAKLSALDRLPMTRQVIEQALARKKPRKDEASLSEI